MRQVAGAWEEERGEMMCSCSSPAATSPEMEPTIWSQLPQHLLDLILLQLPPRSLLLLRSTCKHFNSLFCSPFFHSVAKSGSTVFHSFILLSHPQFPRHTFALCDPVRNRWRTLVIPRPWRAASSSSSLVSSSNGLLCFSTPGSFLIVNLLTGSLKTLAIPNQAFTSAALFASETQSSGGGYKLVLVSDLANSIYLYDSESRGWRSFEGFTQSLRQAGAISASRVYFSTGEPFSLVAFDLETRSWCRPAAEPPPDLTFGRLVSGEEERLFLIGGIGSDGISRSLNIWELGNEAREWLHVGSLPELMRRKFVSVCYHNYDHVYCLWHDGLICVCCYTWPEILAYRISRRTWHWLPRCPSLPEKSSCGFKWFSFVPTLFSPV